MAAAANLKAQKRTESGKSVTRKLRANGRIPAVLYGHGEETRSLTVDAHELDLLFARVHVENTIITLDIEGERSPVKTLVREVQRHSWKPNVLHVDFYMIHAGEKLTVEVPVRLKGQSPGVKLGGIMQHVLDEIEVRCLPDAIPDFIEVDVSALEVGDSIHIRDITFPPGAETTLDPDRTICSVIPPQAGQPSDTPEAPATSEPEVIRARKEGEA